MNQLTQPIRPDSQKRIWHIYQRLDGSITVYYTHTGVDAHYVVYDTLDNSNIELARLAAENERLRAALVPFALIVIEYPAKSFLKSEGIIIWQKTGVEGTIAQVTLAHCIAAYEALQK